MPPYSKTSSFMKANSINLSLSDDQIDQLYQVFLNHRGRNGKLRIDSLKEIFEEFDIHVSEEEEKSWTIKLNLDNGAYLTFAQFTHLMARKMLEAEIEDQIKQLYRVFDIDNKGYVTAKDLKNTLITLNPKIQDEDIEQIMTEADGDQDGVLSYDQFVYMCIPK